jgi:hypothetical protein
MTSKELPLEQQICLDCQFCCKFLIMTSTAEDDTLRKNLVEFNRNWGCRVLEHGDKKTFEICVPIKCRWLNPDGCAIYEDERRPAICRNFNGRTQSAFMQRNCKLFPIRMKEQQDAETGDNKAKGG